MQVLAICGGLRPDSNTNKLVRAIAAATGVTTEIVELASLEIRPCTGCLECAMNEGRCPIPDDMPELCEKLLAADGIVLGSPTYYMNISGAVKCLIDRAMSLYYRGIGPMYDPEMPFMGQRPLAGKPGVVVTTVAGAGQERAVEALHLCLGQSQRLNLVATVAEVVGMSDVADMPEVMERAAAAGRALGQALGR